MKGLEPPDIRDYLHKVTCSAGKSTHVTSPTRDGYTLCGRRWWFECNQGTDWYCVICQGKLAKILSESPEIP